MHESIDERLSHFNKEKADHLTKKIRLVTLAVLLVVIAFLIYGYHKDWFSSEAPLADFISSLGPFGYLLGCVLIFINTLFPIVPGALPHIAVYMSYGPVLGFLTVIIVSILGSMISFNLSRRYGKTFVLAFVPEDLFNKIMDKIRDEKTAVKLAIIAFIVPGVPDDATVMVCGLTRMRPSVMLTILCVFKPLPTLLYLWGFSNIIEWAFQFFIKL